MDRYRRFNGDFNEDGKPDLVTADGKNLTLLLGDGNGKFAAGVNFSDGIKPTFVVVADVNGDGKLDVVSASTQSTIAVTPATGMPLFDLLFSTPFPGLHAPSRLPI